MSGDRESETLQCFTAIYLKDNSHKSLIKPQHYNCIKRSSITGNLKSGQLYACSSFLPIFLRVNANAPIITI